VLGHTKMFQKISEGLETKEKALFCVSLSPLRCASLKALFRSLVTQLFNATTPTKVHSCLMLWFLF